MRDELDKKLCRLAPHLFADRYASMRTTCMCWGFDVGDGWYKLLERVSIKLERLIVAEIAKHPWYRGFDFPRASQVKEKYGTLRFYLTSGTDEMYATIKEAERQSSKTCESCGEPGKLRGKYWVFTRCNSCWKSGHISI